MVNPELFDIPNDPDEIADLVRVIKNGSYIQGMLEAPLDLLSTRQAVSHTGFMLNRSDEYKSQIHTLRPEEDSQNYMQRELDHTERRLEGLVGILLERKHPGFVKFNEAGHDSMIGFDNLLKFVEHYIRLGYRGVVHFYLGYLYRGEFWETDSHITLFVGGVRQHQPTLHKHSISVASNSERGDKFVQPVLDYCRSKGFKNSIT